jgi:glycine cleavage system H protein
VNIRDFILPETLYYSPDHLWVRPEPENIVVIGIDNYLQRSGVLDFVELPLEGEEYMRGEIFSLIGSDEAEWEEELPMPLSGIIAEINRELEIDPEMLNNDCYSMGWLIKLIPTNPDEMLSLIHGKNEIKNWIMAEIAKEND